MIRAAGRLAWRVARALAVGLLVVLCLLWGSPSYAATTPPYPATGGAASSWSCTDVESADVPPLTGADCIVTGWETDPAAPVPVAVEGAPVLTEDQWQVISFALGLLVFLGAAHLVGSWR